MGTASVTPRLLAAALLAAALLAACTPTGSQRRAAQASAKPPSAEVVAQQQAARAEQRQAAPAGVDGGRAAPLPNLTVNGPRITRSARLEWRDFGPNACDIQEGCLARPGRRRLLRFDLETPNVGDADVSLGRPTASDPRFEFSTCHGHRHFLGYARYTLRDTTGAAVAHGHKQSFCLMDTSRNGRVPGRARARYTCEGEQGISAGWSDVYERDLDCQYIDVTDVPAGTYRVEVEINVNRGIRESNYADNTVAAEVVIPASGDAGVPDAGAPGDSLRACASAVTGLDRNCGWSPVTTRTCTPGARVQVGCNAGCAPALGACTGDAMLRVCDGTAPCSHLTMLGQNDDACPPAGGGANQCPLVSFVCPSSGTYTVLTGSFDSGRTSTCTVEVRQESTVAGGVP